MNHKSLRLFTTTSLSFVLLSLASCIKTDSKVSEEGMTDTSGRSFNEFAGKVPKLYGTQFLKEAGGLPKWKRKLRNMINRSVQIRCAFLDKQSQSTDSPELVFKGGGTLLKVGSTKGRVWFASVGHIFVGRQKHSENGKTEKSETWDSGVFPCKLQFTNINETGQLELSEFEQSVDVHVVYQGVSFFSSYLDLSIGYFKLPPTHDQVAKSKLSFRENVSLEEFRRDRFIALGYPAETKRVGDRSSQSEKMGRKQHEENCKEFIQGARFDANKGTWNEERMTRFHFARAKVALYNCQVFLDDLDKAPPVLYDAVKGGGLALSSGFVRYLIGQYFITDIDGMFGMSGGPVFGLKDEQVIGLIASGGQAADPKSGFSRNLPNDKHAARYSNTNLQTLTAESFKLLCQKRREDFAHELCREFFQYVGFEEHFESIKHLRYSHF